MAELSILLAGPDGEIGDPTITWSMATEVSGVPPIGEIQVAPDGQARYLAPEAIDDSPAVGLVRAEVAIGDTTLVGLKGIVIDSPVPMANPRITEVTVGGSPVAVGDGATIDSGAPVELGVAFDPGETPDTIYAWYSTAGEIEQYLSNPTELVAGDPGDGWLFVVVREGAGAAWRSLAVQVQ